MHYMMYGTYGGWMMFFGWFIYLLVVAVLVLTVLALWKYLNKK